MNTKFKVGTVWKANHISFTNDVGGTEIPPDRAWTFKITKAFYDYECGTRLIGEVTTQEQRDALKKLGTTKYGDSSKPYNPSTIYVSEFNVTGRAEEAKPADKVAQAFKELRKRGFFARMNFMCCQSCAGYEIGERKAGKYVFFHKQDGQDRKEGKGFYLAYGDATDSNTETENTITGRVGQEICAVLEKFDVEYQWNGKGDTRIFIRPNQ